MKNHSRERTPIGTVHRLHRNLSVDLDCPSWSDFRRHRGKRIAIHLEPEDRLGPVIVADPGGETDDFAP